MKPKPDVKVPAPAPAGASAIPKLSPTPPTVSFQGVERWLFFNQGYKHVLLAQNCLMVLHLADQAPSAFSRPIRNDSQFRAAINEHVMKPDENAAIAEALACRVKENIDKFNRIHPDDSFQESHFNSVIYLEAIASITIRPAETTVLTVHLNNGSGAFFQRGKRVFHVEPGDGRTVEQTIDNLKQGLPNLVQII